MLRCVASSCLSNKDINCTSNTAKKQNQLHTDFEVDVKYMNIPMLAEEFGTAVQDLPTRHPEDVNFIDDQLFLDQKFYLAVCEGQVLHTRQHALSQEQEVAQLILALCRIQVGGTLVIRLQNPDTSDLARNFQEIFRNPSIPA